MGPPQGVDEGGLGEGGQVADGLHPEALQPGQGGRADAPEPPDGMGMEEGQLRAGLDDQHPVGFGVVAGQLGQELAGGHADGGGQAGLGPDAGPDGRPDLPAVAEEARPAGDVEERLVEGDRLDDRREGGEDPVHRGALGLVDVETRREDDGLGAQPAGPAHGHGRVDAEAAGLVGGGRHHAPGPGAADENGPAGEGGIVEDLDRGVEGVEVDVEDGPIHPGTSARRFCRAR